jgi:RimJ/RimL family protein N-acetyltransferase
VISRKRGCRRRRRHCTPEWAGVLVLRPVPRYSALMIPIPTLETPRFRLRAPERRDFDAHAAMWADERVTRYISGPARDRATSWRAFLAIPGLWALMGYGYWVFADRENDGYIGAGGFSWFERGIQLLEGVPEAGWAIAPDWWAKGVATEVMAAALGWADAVLGTEIRCIINPGHTASERVAAKLGFTAIGHHEMEPDPVNVYARPAPLTPPSA